jgi:hypothetical protein
MALIRVPDLTNTRNAMGSCRRTPLRTGDDPRPRNRRRRRRSRAASSTGDGLIRPADGLCDQGLPDMQSHGRCPMTAVSGWSVAQCPCGRCQMPFAPFPRASVCTDCGTIDADQGRPRRIPVQGGIDRAIGSIVPVVLTAQTMSGADFIALALDHRLQAERSTCPEEQQELHRVADIYTVLATLDIPTAVLLRLAQ